MSGGLLLLASYAYGKTLTDVPTSTGDKGGTTAQNPYCLNRFSRLDPGRLENRQFDFTCPGRDAQLLTCCFDGRRREFLIATDGFVWLSDDTDQLMLAPFAEHSQCRHGDITRADKNDPHSR